MRRLHALRQTYSLSIRTCPQGRGGKARPRPFLFPFGAPAGAIEINRPCRGSKRKNKKVW